MFLQLNGTWHNPPLTTKVLNHVYESLSSVRLKAWAYLVLQARRREYGGSTSLQSSRISWLVFWPLSSETVTLAECSTWWPWCTGLISNGETNCIATAWLDVLDRPPWVQLLLSSHLFDMFKFPKCSWFVSWVHNNDVTNCHGLLWPWWKQWDSLSSRRYLSPTLRSKVLFMCTILLVRVLGSISKFFSSGLQQRLSGRLKIFLASVKGSEVYQDCLHTCTTVVRNSAHLPPQLQQ